VAKRAGIERRPFLFDPVQGPNLGNLHPPENGRNDFQTGDKPSDELLCAEASRLAYKSWSEIRLARIGDQINARAEYWGNCRQDRQS